MMHIKLDDLEDLVESIDIIIINKTFRLIKNETIIVKRTTHKIWQTICCRTKTIVDVLFIRGCLDYFSINQESIVYQQWLTFASQRE